MPKKEIPLHQPPVGTESYSDIKIHLAEILEKKCFPKSIIFSYKNAENTIKKLQR